MSDLGTSLASLLTAAARRDPDGIAIREPLTSGNVATLTWNETVIRSGKLAAALRRAGVQPGDRVGVHYRKTTDAFLAMHAVVQQGAIAVPLDPTASPAYVASVCEQTNCGVVLTHALCRSTIAGLVRTSGVTTFIGIDATMLDSVMDETTTPDKAPRHPAISDEEVAAFTPAQPVDIDLDQPAYIITTSGSTGRPKGICHSHRSAMAYIQFKLAAYDLTSADRISDIAPNHFDISTLALWVTPFVGATNVIVPEQYQMFPASLAKLAEEEKISVWYSVPYLLTQLLARGTIAERNLTSLRWILFGGEVFPTQSLSDLMQLLPGARFSNVYGPAEINACAIHHLKAAPAPGEPIPIGRAFSDTRIKLVPVEDVVYDPRYRVGRTTNNGQPATQPGEIWVTGSTTMLGYWERSDLDDGAFVNELDHATTKSEPTRWYRTGDLGWTNDAGDLVFAGRIDHQVKVRGHRVELESIESVLEDNTDIEYAVATVARAEDGSDIIIAGLLLPRPSGAEGRPSEAAGLDVTQVRRQAADRLPSYAVPSTFYFLHTAPTTGSGKLDRRLLRRELIDRHESSKG